MIEKNPDLDEFIYEIDDDSDYFQIICNLFNFESITITNNNMESLKQFSEDLGIECINNKIDDFIELYETATQRLIDKQAVIDEIDEIFDLLYNRKKMTLDSVYNSIITSKWLKKKDGVIELAAFIHKVIQTDIRYHQFLFDLMLKLDKEGESKYVKFLVPTIVNKLLDNLNSGMLKSAFAYKLYKHGLISKSEIALKVHDFFINYKNHSLPSPWSAKNPSSSDNYKPFLPIIWFYPEINEIYNDKIEDFEKKFDNKYNVFAEDFISHFIKNNNNNNFEELRNKRELGEPDDALTKALIIDDVDTFQSIISQRNLFPQISRAKIPFNLYESFTLNGGTTYINYAASRGSVSCFKYLLLNNCIIDETTLSYAVFGENCEIVRLVDQYYSENNITIDLTKPIHSFYVFNLEEYQSYVSINPIIPAIFKNQNDLFDWILQEKFINKDQTGNCLLDLLDIASKNGNAHALVQFIDNGLDLNVKPIMNSFSASVSNGFFRYTQLLFHLVKKPKDYALKLINESMKFDSVSMFKLVIEKCLSINNFDEILDYAILHLHFDIIKYIVESDVKLTKNGYLNCLKSSISINSEIFHFLLNKFGFEKLISDHHFSEEQFIQIVYCGCQNNKIDDVKILTDMIIEKYLDASFTYPFMVAVQNECYDIYKYFMDKNIFIDLYIIGNNSKDLKSIDVDVFCKLIEKADPEMKEYLIVNFLLQTLISHNKKLAEYLLLQNIPYNNALFDSVSSQDVDMVKIVIKYNSKPSFINQLSDQGTALYRAVLLGNSEIVSFLLTIPEIDPNLYQQKNQTPLVLAIINLDMKNIDILLNFFGDEIENQMWQLNEALDGILEKISSNENSNQNSKTTNKSSRWNNPQWRQKFNIVKNEETIDHKLVLTVIKRLIGIKNIDLNRHSQNHTLLTYACQNNDLELVKMLIESEKVDINSYAPQSGFTPLMIAIDKNNMEIAKLLIESPRCNINISNYMKETAITIAVNNKRSEIVSLLIKNQKFDPIESRLDYAFFISKGLIPKLLASLTKLDVNLRDSICLETPLIHAVKSNNINKCRLILNHKSFNPIKSQSKLAIFYAVELGHIDIFRLLLPLVNNDVNISLERNVSLLVCAVNNRREDIINEIINNENFDSNKSNLLDAFVGTYGYKPTIRSNQNSFMQHQEKALINSMTLIHSYDSMHDHCIDFSKLLPNGKSFFTSININLSNIDNVIQFLLNNGAQPDMPDLDGVYPLEHAIKLNSYTFVNLLLETRNIDLKRTFCDTILELDTSFSKSFQAKNSDGKPEKKGQFRENLTYLHLAAKIKDSRIFNDLLNLNAIDVNSVDDHGETPLFIAIRYVNEVVIQSLFILDNLDYKHVNNDGVDPLKVYLKNDSQSKIQKSSQINSKGDYMSKILDNINCLKLRY